MHHVAIFSNLPDDIGRSIITHIASLLPGVEISTNQRLGCFYQCVGTAADPTPEVGTSFIAKPPGGAHLVTLEEIIVRGLKPILDEMCPKCGQVDRGQTGKHPCPACGLPLVHDAQQT